MIKIEDFTIKWKEKETGNIVTLISKSYGGTGTTVTIADAEGIPLHIDGPDFYKRFKPVRPNFESVKDNIIELCNLSDQFRNLGCIVLKRLDPEYFKVGSQVYISNINFFSKRAEYESEGGPSHPYKILFVRNKKSVYYHGNCTLLEVGISKTQRNKDEEPDYTFIINPVFPEPSDAYWFLTRYDKPY